ncbi:hypothetical protein MSHOH_2029 [Methanosarcina horonobensis HB-1 = JCM 15518]|uniref:Uncharacterized protein n=1 Tax=Methanosarcina horonobensis HB-1 = JCM 15518 TaxID=1434110 RepID=A0A0E3SEA8_9EURY|nr:hypothetical protein [Methanosarcina horonobensis]AKB78512.1 hypothetical protein MSHOH_2029 [Methanosarcina horonobensis HB-1 = JCM 15518]
MPFADIAASHEPTMNFGVDVVGYCRDLAWLKEDVKVEFEIVEFEIKKQHKKKHSIIRNSEALFTVSPITVFKQK